ncbi:hypothetical protein Scep_017386 [Stephania cephalantha]|uniref:Origin recognition complex subunit 6 n=1 Tax=Stephania cephalantha TaxID=152367 RepID=A0AAP0IPE1_9MAGN
MDLLDIARKLGLSDSKLVICKAEELRCLSDLQFDSSVIGVGEVCKAVICLEIAATRLQVMFDRESAIKLNGMSEKGYIRSFNAMQNGIGVNYKDRFVASLPASRWSSADFTRPVFTAVAFYLCAKKHKVSTSMKDLCFDVFGISKEKKDPKAIKGHRELLNVLLPGKHKQEEVDDDASDDNSSENDDDDDALEDNLELVAPHLLVSSSYIHDMIEDKVIPT